MRSYLASLTLALVCCAASVSGQSIFNSAGVGLPVEALDGRARALGSFGIGLPGASLLPADPGGAGRLLFPTGVFSAQPTWAEYTEDGSSEIRDSQGGRFPLIGMAYPVFGGTATIQLTSFLDQNFSGERPVIVDLGGVPAEAADYFRQDGSVSTILFGYGRYILPNTSLGLNIGRYAGTVERRLARDFGDTTGSGDVADYETRGLWSYSGEVISAGLSSDLSSLIRVAASATWSSGLGAQAIEQTTGVNRSFSIPLQLMVGASVRLSPGLIVVASATSADWSQIEKDLVSGAKARATRGFGVGLELSQARVLGKEAPLRVGYRSTQLPFTLRSGVVQERIFSGGLALTLNETDGVVLATTDLAVERGQRSGGSITEDFWRGTVSVRLASF